MRDPKRIDKILNRLKKVWRNNPDLRLGQLILNTFSIHNGVDSMVYRMEDEEFIKKIEDLYEQ